MGHGRVAGNLRANSGVVLRLLERAQVLTTEGATYDVFLGFIRTFLGQHAFHRLLLYPSYIYRLPYTIYDTCAVRGRKLLVDIQEEERHHQSEFRAQV